MDLFVIREQIACDDVYYGWKQYVYRIYDSLETAKQGVYEYVVTLQGNEEPFDGKNHEPFIQIVQMKIGSSGETVVMDTRKPEHRKEMGLVDVEKTI